MKKKKRQHETKQEAATSLAQTPGAGRGWMWAAGAAGFILALFAYSPALDGAFVLDDRSAPFMDPAYFQRPMLVWLTGTRQLLMLTYWLNYQLSEASPGSYHFVNIVIHFFGAVLFALVAARFLTWANVTGNRRSALATFAGALFLLHPVQTESVAYVSSRSELLSVFFFLAAYALWLYADESPVSVIRSVIVVLLFAAAVKTKEHTVMLLVLVPLTDYFWKRGGIRRNRTLYGLLVIGAAFGAYVITVVLRGATSAGFNLANMSVATYFFTECRVIWIYVQLFVFPWGLNADRDIALSHSLLEHGAIIGLAALVASAAFAWIYRKRFPLASFGTFVFFLLLAPTSSLMPIDDVYAERRLYLPFLGLALIALEFIRRLEMKQIAWACAAVVAVFTAVTYQRSQVWASPLALWTDTVSKSPRKVRPHFQLAYAYYEQGDCPQAVDYFEATSKLAQPKYDLLVDWALALDCARRTDDAISIAKRAAVLEQTAHVHSMLGMLYAKTGDLQTALVELATAEKIDPRFEMTYVYRGTIAERAGDRATAAKEYRRALAINPYNGAAQTALARATR